MSRWAAGGWQVASWLEAAGRSWVVANGKETEGGVQAPSSTRRVERASRHGDGRGRPQRGRPPAGASALQCGGSGPLAAVGMGAVVGRAAGLAQCLARRACVARTPASTSDTAPAPGCAMIAGGLGTLPPRVARATGQTWRAGLALPPCCCAGRPCPGLGVRGRLQLRHAGRSASGAAALRAASSDTRTATAGVRPDPPDRPLPPRHAPASAWRRRQARPGGATRRPSAASRPGGLTLSTQAAREAPPALPFRQAPHLQHYALRPDPRPSG